MSQKQIKASQLDDAMRELIGICQEIEDKSSVRNQPSGISSKSYEQKKTSILNGNHHGIHHSNENVQAKPPQSHLFTPNCDGKSTDIDTKPTRVNLSVPNSKQNMELSSIEKMQQKQSELQMQLDEHLAIARDLELKRKRKMGSCLLEDEIQNTNTDRLILTDDDDELIEFQQIENELKLTELNRQLSNVQEELRVTLYKRLLSNTTKLPMNQEKVRQTDNSQSTSKRRNSAQTDESTPPSSSCSDEQAATSSNLSPQPELLAQNQQHLSNNISTTSSNSSFDLINQFNDRLHIIPGTDSPQQSTNSNTGEFSTAERETNNDTNSDTSSIKSNQANNRPKSDQITSNINNPTDLDMILEQINNFEIPMPANQFNSAEKPLNLETYKLNVQSQFATFSNQNHYQTSNSLYLAGNRMTKSSLSKDLERIDEGEEEDQGYHCYSNKLRTIYEEKLSPIIRAGASENDYKSHQFNISASSEQGPTHCETQCQMSRSKIEEKRLNQMSTSPRANYDKFNPNNVNSAKRSNRPLTMYLPKPDENINLLEHIQALGHDISLISSDIKLDSSSASGYLYKSCSNNLKKRTKRFFHFDRDKKTLSYYENEEQLVKKNSSPNNIIPFDEIGDVYVDHGLSNVSEKQKNPKKNSHVFVLATMKRKYTLSTSRAETMRAWIDVLFTSARANDYFQQLDDCSEDNSEPQYTSLCEE